MVRFVYSPHSRSDQDAECSYTSPDRHSGQQQQHATTNKLVVMQKVLAIAIVQPVTMCAEVAVTPSAFAHAPQLVVCKEPVVVVFGMVVY